MEKVPRFIEALRHGKDALRRNILSPTYFFLETGKSSGVCGSTFASVDRSCSTAVR
jgi:hypothetical protein